MIRMTPQAMRQMYESGYGVARIMAYTGYPYIEVRDKLLDSGTHLITGGPHDVDRCRHDHRLAGLHARGATCCTPLTRAERVEAASAGRAATL